ncbi:MAG: NADH dehydrogenase subunit [Methanomicrobiales archaeon HGW-Methanomicrobiales-1]|jgi:ech hydrogenase subunit D|nr:MAG: NADH dehydrogenase subunit [Methanomicrobiales archaeon HGW-Methanomicrobiales-1]
MMEPQTILPISVGEVVTTAERAKKEGNRLVQIGCTKIEENFEIIYTYDKDYKLTNYRITVKQDAEIPSISGVYFGAFVYENEIHDLYGIHVTGINIDFKGTFYKTAIKHPFSVTIVKEDDPCQNK